MSIQPNFELQLVVKKRRNRVILRVVGKRPTSFFYYLNTNVPFAQASSPLLKRRALIARFVERLVKNGLVR